MRADDERAFEAFMARVGDRMLVSAVLLVGGDWAAAEDLLQGALERTYLRWEGIHEGGHEAYLRRALINAATSRWRRLRARVAETALADEGSWVADPAVPDVDEAERLTQRDGLMRALRALPPRQRAVIVLRYVEDLPEAQVAAMLGCSLGSVRSQASRGLARLRASEHLRDLDLRAAAPLVRRRPEPDILTNEFRGVSPRRVRPGLAGSWVEGERL